MQELPRSREDVARRNRLLAPSRRPSSSSAVVQVFLGTLLNASAYAHTEHGRAAALEFH
jgi:hypothetical protein